MVHQEEEVGHEGASLPPQGEKERGETLRGRLLWHPVNLGWSAAQGKNVHALGHGQLEVSDERLVPKEGLVTQFLHCCRHTWDEVKSDKC